MRFSIHPKSIWSGLRNLTAQVAILPEKVGVAVHLRKPFGDTAEQTRTVEIAPKLFCENGFDSTSATTCGYGGSLSMALSKPQKGTTFDLMLDHEQGERSARTRVELRREQTLLNGAASKGID